MAYSYVSYATRKAIKYKNSIGINVPKVIIDFQEIKKGDEVHIYYALASKIAIVSKLSIDEIEELIKEIQNVFLTLDRKFKRNEIGEFKKNVKNIVF